MPLYEYACLECAHEFEDFGPSDAVEHPACPKCGGKSKRLISATSFKTGRTTPFSGLDSVKMMHPAARPKHLNTTAPCAAGKCPSKS
ncbi:MAG: FmdB family zinc ribbon protein [Desulfovibrio sp.]|uniref:FmdB family zinc ribbon protein n=1 Tax=Desulfovibrio sp. 7SRBS1 TaxID=3378064 RepID=UPI003B4072B0